MLKPGVIFFFVLFAIATATAQTLTGFNLSGSITDNHRQPIPGATVKLVNTVDTLYVYSSAADIKGKFLLKNLPPANYNLIVTAVAYQTYKIPVTINYANVSLPVTVITESIKALNQVTVNAQMPTIQIAGGKLTYHVEQSAVAAGNTAFELLRRMPGFSAGQDENLIFKGSSQVNIMLDGKTTYLTAQQLNNMLKSMPADQISKIEIMTAPPAQYEAAGNSGIINIITRKSTRNGYAANITGGITLGRYLLNSESITGNARTDHFNIFGSLGYSYRHSYTMDTNSQQGLSGGLPVFIDREGINPHTSYYYNYKAGIDIYLGKKSQAGFAYTGSTDNWTRDANGKTFLRNSSGAFQSFLLEHNYAKEPYYNNVYNLNYKYTIDTTGKILTADADYINYRNNSDGYLSTQNFNAGGAAAQPYVQLNFHQPSYIDIRSVKSDLTYPWRHFDFKGGLKFSSVLIHNDFRYDSLQNNVSSYALSLSDNFVYQEQIAAAYLSAGRHWMATDLNFGLRVEHTYADGNAINLGIENKRLYTDFFPTLAFNHQLNSANKIEISLSRRINRPSYSNLNPVRYYQDQYAYYQGNPNLIPEKAWIANLSYTYLTKYIASFSYSSALNFIDRSAVIDQATNILVTSTTNSTHKDRMELQLIIPVNATPWWEVNTSATASYTTYALGAGNLGQNIHRITVDLFASQAIKLPGKVDAELLTHYTSPELIGAFLEHPYFSLDGGAKKSFFHKKIDMRFSFADLFHTGYYWAASISDTAAYNYKNTPDSRRFSLTFSYHIGGKLSTGNRHQIDEQGRL